MTTLFLNGVGLSFTAPAAYSTSYTQQSWGGNWVGPYYTQQWYGNNLTYVAGSVTPASGTLTQLVVTSATTGQVIFSVAGTNYSVKDSDIDLPPPCRTKVMEQSPLISENSGYETIQIYR
jgi:hypothetical protein